MKDLETLKGQLRNLPQNRDLTDTQLTRKAEEVEKTKSSKIDIEKLFTDLKEKKLAKSLLGKYLQDYIVENISDRNILQQLIYLEVLQYRFQNDANKFHKDAKATPSALVNQIHENLRMIMDLKKLLDDRSGRKDDEIRTLNKLKKKFRIWLDENQGHRTMLCPHCAKMVLLRIKMDQWDPVKHPFFKDRILYNEHLMYLYKKDKITKDDIAKILNCSDDFIDWVIQKVEKPNGQKLTEQNKIPEEPEAEKPGQTEEPKKQETIESGGV